MRFFPFGSTRSLLRNIATAAPRFLPPSSSSSILYAPALAPVEPINVRIVDKDASYFQDETVASATHYLLKSLWVSFASAARYLLLHRSPICIGFADMYSSL